MPLNPNIQLLDTTEIAQHEFDVANDAERVNIVAVDPSVIIPVSATFSSASLDVIASVQIPFSSINGSGGLTTTVVASTVHSISLVIPNEQTGATLNLYVGASGSEVLKFIIAPGQDNEVNVNIPAGSRISIRSASVTAPAAGSITLTFCG